MLSRADSLDLSMFTWTTRVRPKRPRGPRLMRLQKAEMSRRPDWPRTNQFCHLGGRLRKFEGNSEDRTATSFEGWDGILICSVLSGGSHVVF